MVTDLLTALRVIQYFYKFLQDRHPKDVALHLAKKAYLKEAKDLKKAPKFWAVFVFNGDDVPFGFEEVNTPASSYFLSGLAILLLIGLGLYFKTNGARVRST